MALKDIDKQLAEALFIILGILLFSAGILVLTFLSDQKRVDNVRSVFFNAASTTN